MIVGLAQAAPWREAHGPPIVLMISGHSYDYFKDRCGSMSSSMLCYLCCATLISLFDIHYPQRPQWESMIVGSPFSPINSSGVNAMPPVKTEGISAILSDKLRLSEDTATLNASWNTAKPFKHITLDNVFESRLLDRVCEEIPRIDDETWVRENDDHIKQFNHRSPVSLGGAASELVNLLHSAAFLYFLSEVTGIWELLPDPYLQGASFHVVPRGGFFHVHADRNTAYSTGLIRRLALMLYLNKGWKPEYGGQFELWNENGHATRQIGRADLQSVFNL